MENLTPMMRQYYEIKSEYSDCILFFRLGDFYEMFGDDAVVGAEILDITLTARHKDPMCGVPYHSAESYIAKLNQKGKKVAICEQVSTPNGKGIVERKVVRVVTPGTNLSSHTLDAKTNQYVGGIAQEDSRYFVTFCDVSTGELMIGEVGDTFELKSLINSYNPRELVADNVLSENPEINRIGIQITPFTLQEAEQFLINHFKTKTLNSFGLNKGHINSIALTLQYLESVLKTQLNNVSEITFLNSDDSFDLDQTTIFNLEIFYTMRDFDKKNSLLSVIDKTVTSAGGRLLKKRVLKPLKNLHKLQERLNATSSFYKIGTRLHDLRSILKKTHDIERVISRLSLGYGNPRDIAQIRETLILIPELNNLLPTEKLSEFSELLNFVSLSICDEPPISRREGGIFRDGYSTEIDELRILLREGKSYIAALKKSEIERTGISNLKIGFNKVFGYFIEISKGKTDLVPENYIRKQTLANSERYITPELKEYEEKVLNAEDKLKILEDQMFEQVIQEVLKYSNDLRIFAINLAKIDFSSSLAALAHEQRYCKPVLSESGSIEITAGRHPVVEAILPAGSFVPNDANFNDKTLKLITGPNMGGKSTYLRQVALIILMAQIGSYVPAESASIGLCDQIFSRVGAADNLAQGLSTFMVEMEETAFILRHATGRSFLILDEIGRGTSTYDGVSIAWAVLEHVHNVLCAKTLFATHYHELIQVADSLPNCENLSVSVEEDANGEPVFLHKINKGAIDQSYGIHVAKIAGLPKTVISRSEEILIDLEQSHDSSKAQTSARAHKPLYEAPKLFETDSVHEALKAININNLTPLEALQKLHELKNESS